MTTIVRSKFNVQFFSRKILKSKEAEGRRRGSKGWMDRDEHSRHIDQYEARVLRCTHVERPSPGPEFARLLT
jgi:hypothetical protein